MSQTHQQNQKSMMSRLLWSVNIISFCCLAVLCLVVVVTNNRQIEESIRSKAESVSEFLQAVGSVYVANYDTSALDTFAKIVSADEDFEYVVYYDRDK